MKMEKREWLRKQVLELYARGIEVYQTQIDNSVDIDKIDDLVILEQIESLKELRSRHKKLTRDINDDLNVLLSQVNQVDIKNFNKINFLIQNDTETQIVDVLFWLSVFEEANLTEKQKQLLIDVVSGFGFSGKAKDFSFLCKKLEKSKKEKCKMNKRQFTADEMRKLFPTYYAKPNTLYDEYLNLSRKLDCYIEDVEKSKRKGEYLRSISLKYAIFPMELDEE